MHLVFDFHTGRFGVRFASLFHFAEDLHTLGEPGVFIHVFFLISSFDRLILPAFLFSVHPSCKNLSRTPVASS
jgi:hypothetical protein